MNTRDLVRGLFYVAVVVLLGWVVGLIAVGAGDLIYR